MPMNKLANLVPGCRFGMQVAQVEYETIKYVTKLKKENQKLKKELREIKDRFAIKDDI